MFSYIHYMYLDAQAVGALLMGPAHDQCCLTLVLGHEYRQK